jgi:hypothetical protein
MPNRPAKLHWLKPWEIDPKSKNNWLKAVTACGQLYIHCDNYFNIAEPMILKNVTCKTCLKAAAAIFNRERKRNSSRGPKRGVTMKRGSKSLF